MIRYTILALASRHAVAAASVLMLIACETGTTENGNTTQGPGAGTVGGPCYPNGTCNEGLECTPLDVCQSSSPPIAGTVGNACYPNGTCNDGLECNPSNVCQSISPQNDGPTQDAVFPTSDVAYEPNPGGQTDDCPQTTATMDVPWLSQAIAGHSISSNLCCGPAVVTMAKGYVDGKASVGDDDLKATIDWMASHLGVASNNYNCSGTSNDDVASALKQYVGVDAEAIKTPWCNLLNKLDGNHIVVFHGDSQGSNNTNIFKAGASHWLILEHVDTEYAYVNDPGRSYDWQGHGKKYTIESVRARYESPARGELAIIATVAEPACPNPPGGSVSSPIDGAKVCDDFHATGQVQDFDGVDRVTVTFEDLENCKFSHEVSGSPSSYSYDITVIPDGACSLSEGSHTMAVWVRDSCGGAKVAAQSTVFYQCDDLCTDTMCSECQMCSLATGNCVPDFGANGDSCATDKVCSNGICVSNNLCATVSCSTCQHCNGGSCVPDSSQDGDWCGSGKVCSNGSCVFNDPCATVSCSACQHCSGGSCVPDSSQNGDSCGSNKVCSDGTCLSSDPCLGVSCAVCQHCTSGTCSADASQNGDWCAPGKVCSSGVCIQDGPTASSGSCTEYRRGESTTCTLSGSGFAVGGTAWVDCLESLQVESVSASEVVLTGKWTCSCPLGQRSAIYKNPNNETAEWTSIGTTVLGKTVVTDHWPSSAKTGTTVQFGFNGCNLGTILYVGGVQLSNITMPAEDQVVADGHVAAAPGDANVGQKCVKKSSGATGDDSWCCSGCMNVTW